MKIALQLLLLIVCLSIFIINPLIAQEVITHSVGDDISAEEALAFELFSDIFGFTGAKFNKISGKKDTYLMSYTYESEEGENRVKIEFGTGLKELFNMSLVQLDSVFSGFEVHNYQKIKIELSSGTSLIGSFIRWNGNDITLLMEFGEQSIQLEIITELSLLDLTLILDAEYLQPVQN